MSGDGKLWRISGFSNGPHWDTAIVRAATAESAADALAAMLTECGEDDLPDGVWDVEDRSDWNVTGIADGEPVVFLLGAGCRS